MTSSDDLVEVSCKIQRFELNPKGGQNVFVECRIGERVWIKNLWLNYDRPISLEEFKRELANTNLIPADPEDPLCYVKEEAGKPFTLTVPRPVIKK